MDKIELAHGVYATNYYALWMQAYDAVVIADLHIGLEAAMVEEEGISAPRVQRKIIMTRLEKIFSKLNPSVMIINGDFKHKFSKNMWQEWVEVTAILEYIMEKVDNLVVVRGNHDNYLQTILAKRGIRLKHKVKLGDFVIFHGHKATNLHKNIIMAHEHPVIKLRDNIGAYIKVPCFLHEKDQNIIVMPAISPLSIGTDVTAEDFLSPLLRQVSLKNALVYGISEIGLLHLGPLKNIIEQNVAVF